MTLQEFKDSLGGGPLSMYKSTTGSGRHVGSRGDITYLTTKDFNAASPAFVYNSVDSETGEVLPKVFIISNKAPRAADLTL